MPGVNGTMSAELGALDRSASSFFLLTRAMSCCSSGTATIRFLALLRAAQNGSPAQHPKPKPPKQRHGQHGEKENLEALNLFRVHGSRESASGRCRPALWRGVERRSAGRQHQATADDQEYQGLEEQQSNAQG